MESLSPNPEQVFHIRTILAVVMGLSLTRLLTGFARIVQHPSRKRIYLVHLGWGAFLFLTVIHFWWFEFRLTHVERWTFVFYFFLICYAALLFFICSILFPDHMDEYAGFRDYFHSRQKWFYGLLASIFVVDVVDTLWKGTGYFIALGAQYSIRQALMFALAIIAMFVKNKSFHIIFVSGSLIAQVIWILYNYQNLDF
ncbi:hypothetical protein [Chelativorans sp. YIM 93263]|uniref:hypothetical protein n=1 Tax=Chelativorans sp. YIM 93263 TaxID=2906648 RepID=UPI002378631C|nr:hypothetical protein [Chelativorans sp. YIM 93263]